MEKSFLTYTMDEYQSKISFISDMLVHQTDSKLSLLLQNLIQKYQLDHSCNTNGIFLNLSTLDESIINELHELVLTYSMESYKPELPQVNQPEKPKLEPKPTSSVQKDTLTLTKFDKVLIGLSKQQLSI